MIIASLIVIGTILAAASITVSVGAAASNRIELYRWVTEQLPGAHAAKALLARPARFTRGAGGVTAAAVLLAGFGVAGTVADLPAPLLVVAVGLLAVPVFVGVVYVSGRLVGRRWPEDIVRHGVGWVERASRVLAPVRRSPKRRGERLDGGGAVSPEDLAGELGTEALSAVSEVLTFAERPVREIMTPRTDVVAVEDGATLEEISAAFAESGFSRIPVYRDTLDNVVSMVYAIDLFKVQPGGELPRRPVATAPGSKPCGDLLFQMQRDRQQLAAILDEYGGTAGIVTFDDLVQVLVETITPSSTSTVAIPSAVDVLEVTGTTPLADIATRLEVSLSGEAETIGGMLARAAGRIPATGERFRYAGLEFDILEASATRIERVAVRRGIVPVVNLQRRNEL